MIMLDLQSFPNSLHGFFFRSLFLLTKLNLVEVVFVLSLKACDPDRLIIGTLLDMRVLI